jgi:hypothetical protein
MSIEPEVINVVQDTQENYIIYDREVSPNPDPPFNTNILVTYDNLSNRLYFNMFYTFDDRELDNKEITVLWVNANNEKGMSLCVDKTLEGDRLTFAWNVPEEATYKAGIIQFAVRITTDNYVWNSLPATVEVKQGLLSEEYNSLEEAQLDPGWVDYIEHKYKVGITKLTQQEFDSLTNKDSNCMYLVQKTDNTYSQYLGNTVMTNVPPLDSSLNLTLPGNLTLTDTSNNTTVNLLTKIAELESRITELESR